MCLQYVHFSTCVLYPENVKIKYNGLRNDTIQETEEVQKNSKYNKHNMDILRKFIPKKKKEWYLTMLSIQIPYKYFYKYFTKCIFPYWEASF